MSRLDELRNMTPGEVERIHRVNEAIGADNEKAIEAIADLRAYCGRAWPQMLEQALRRYQKTRRGECSVYCGAEREIGNVMVDARHCLEQLSEIDGPGLLVENADLRAAIKHLGHNPVTFINRAKRRRERSSAGENRTTPG